MDWSVTNGLDVDETIDENFDTNVNMDEGVDEADNDDLGGDDDGFNEDENDEGEDDHDKLLRILTEWRQRDYETKPSSLLTAYFLPSKYDLRGGKPTLTGVDARRFSFVSAGATDLGYIVCLADYERLLVKDRLYTLKPVCKTIRRAYHIVDINGEPILGDLVLKLDRGSVIEPKGMKPDHQWTDNIDHWSRSKQWILGTVLILFHKENVEEILIGTMRAQDALLELQSSPAISHPTARSKKLARYVLKVVRYDESYTYDEAMSMNRSVADFALNRRDLQLWREAVTSPCRYHTFRSLQQLDVLRACQVFGFGNVCPSFKVVYSSHAWDEWVTFLCDMPTYLSQSVDAAELYGWCKKQVAHGLGIVEIWDDRRIPQVMTIARTFGIRCLHAIRYDTRYGLDAIFALGIVERLHIERHNLFSSIGNQVASDEDSEDPSGVTNPFSSPEQVMDSIIHQWISSVFDHLLRNLRHPDADDKYNDYDPDHYDGYPYRRRVAIVKLIPRCIRVFMVAGKNCQGMLDDVLKLPGDESIKLQDIYAPLVRNLVPLLQEFKHAVNSPSFAPFFRHVIELSSRLLLGSRTRNPQFESLLRRIDMIVKCDCYECVKLNAFMKQLHVPQRTFLVSRPGLRHFALQLRLAPKLASFQKLPSERGCCIKIIKSDLFAEHRWDVRVKRFKAFLRLIGNDDAIEELMGEGYRDLKAALES
ncbi:hypothetical protein APHAL10511_008512 [Amanita phalloides]|nr:hypothetical protein APHAL10511_008512 [Amanita phalloides]